MICGYNPVKAFRPDASSTPFSKYSKGVGEYITVRKCSGSNVQ